ncbi:MAG: response regulator transcription factor [Clostridiales bacterium]|jgi:two-component system alkaline phosphatase synthesis response regulator PhoP|nr:response regulator transcription factor [Clostridiales bacterium]
MPSLIYIADDEPNIRRLASLALRDLGFETQEFADGATLLTAVRRRAPDAIVLDWMMPPPDGLTVCKKLREDEATRPVPILMLTARSEEVDRVLGLEIGADDYITKPFSVKELCARVRAVIRRKEYLTPSGDDVITCDSLSVDVARRQVTKGGVPIELTMKEFDLLVMLMRNRGRVLTRDALLDKVWGVEYFGDARTVDVHIRYLRQKVEDEPDHPKWIVTLRGVGYRFASGEKA